MVSSTIKIGQVIKNRYRVDDFIASGGMANVYRVWDLKRNVPLAMKVLHADLAEDDTAYKLFLREANALKKLAHPHIVPFYGSDRTDDFDFLLEGFINGPTLKQILRRQPDRPLPIQDSLVILKAITAALGYAHNNGVVHCDVKPGNVMIDPGGNVYLTDFGIARHSDSTKTTLASAGTVAYMSPEQIRGEAVSAATDIYALGIMLYEMLTGQRPFRGEEATGSTPNKDERIRSAHLTKAPPDPCSMNPDLPGALGQVLLKALHKDPQQRYGNTRTLLLDACAAVGLKPETLPDRLTPLPVESVPDGKGTTPPHSSPTILGIPGKVFYALIIGLPILLVVGFFFSKLFTQNTDDIIETPTFPIEVSAGNTTAQSEPIDTPIPTVVIVPTEMPTATITPSWQQGRLVFSMKTGSTTNERGLYTLDLTSVDDPVLLLPSQGNNYSGTVWSPGGSQIAFYEPNDYNVILIDANGGQPHTITTGCTQPGWLPGGISLVCKTRDASTRIVDVTSGAERVGPVSQSGMALPDWSPLGDALVYAVFGESSTTRIYLASTSGGGETLIAGQATENYGPAWSNDGQWIAYQSNLGSEWSEIWIMDRYGNNARQITDSRNGWFARGPSWSPDDQWIAYVTGPGGDDWGEIYVVPVGGGNPTQITFTGGDVYDWRVDWGIEIGNPSSAAASNPLAPAQDLVRYHRPSSAEYQSTRSIWNLSPFQDLYTPGTMQYRMRVQEDDVWSWDFTWCAIDEDHLRQILAPLTLRYIVNGETISNNEIYQFEGEARSAPGWKCHYWSVILSDWQPGSAINLRLEYSLSEEINDGEERYPPGDYIHNIAITVD